MMRALAISAILAAILSALEVILGVVGLLVVLVPLCAIAFAVEAAVLGRIDHRNE